MWSNSKDGHVAKGLAMRDGDTVTAKVGNCNVCGAPIYDEALVRVDYDFAHVNLDYAGKPKATCKCMLKALLPVL